MLTVSKFNNHTSNLLQKTMKKSYSHSVVQKQNDKVREENKMFLFSKNSEEVKNLFPF